MGGEACVSLAYHWCKVGNTDVNFSKKGVLSSSFLGQEGRTTTPAPQSVQMIAFRANSSSQNHATALVVIEMCTGLTAQAIED